MFEKVRKPGRGKAITAYLLFGAICVVFIFFGLVPQQMGLTQNGTAAVVNNYQVSQAEFARTVQGLERQYSQQLEMLPEAQRQSQMTQLRARALEQLVESELLYQSASKEGIMAADAEVREAIGTIPAFQEAGKFRREYYLNYLQSAGYSPGQFEERVRKDIVVEKVRNLFLSSFQPVKGESEKSQQLTNTKINLNAVKFTQKTLEESLPVTEADVKAFLADPANLEKAKAKYQTDAAKYTVPAQVRARHILLNKKPNETDQDLQAKVDTAVKRVQTEDFAKVAKEMSADVVSAKEGGDLKYFSRGKMMEEFENAAFNLEVGQISPPVKTQYGVHIIKLEDKKAAGARSFEEVQTQVVRQMLSQTKVPETLEQLRAATKEGNTALVDELVAKLGLKWEETGEFDLSSNFIPKLGQNDAVLSAVARNPVVGKVVPQLVESGGEYYVVKVKALKLPGSEPVKENEQISNFFVMRRAGDAFSTWLKAEREDARVQMNPQLVLQQ